MKTIEQTLDELIVEARSFVVLLQQATQLFDINTENGNIFKDVGFAYPKNITPYLKHIMLKSFTGNIEEIKRLQGMLLFIKLLLALDELTYDEAYYLRERLSHGFRGLGSNKKLNEALIRIETNNKQTF